MLSLPIDIAIFPLTFGYYIIGRFFLAKTLIATDDCNACEKCVKQCPVEAISMVDERPFWSYTCESCMRCVSSCSQRAIETTHAFAIGMLLSSSLLITPLLIALLSYFGIWDYIKQSPLIENIWSIVYAAIFILIVIISYRIVHFLMRFKLVNRILKYTSLSSYQFWRRYKPPKVKGRYSRKTFVPND